jgi:D-inositol-3-phosphate glycosyltransferase
MLNRIATLMLHTSPLEQAGVGDAGGMNIYVLESAKKMANSGVEVDIFTLTNKAKAEKIISIAPGVRVVNLQVENGLDKEALPFHLDQIKESFWKVLDSEKLTYDLLHSHYWLSGKVSLLANEKLNLPLVQTMHTMALVKNKNLANDERPEPQIRIIGEREVITNSQAIIANTGAEASSLVSLYGACPENVHVVAPGVDLDNFIPVNRVGREKVRKELGITSNQIVLTFVGRLQPHKGPDVLLQSLATLFDHNPILRNKVVALIIGGNSGAGGGELEKLKTMAQFLHLTGNVKFIPPVPRTELADWYAASDIVCVPSYSESFGLVALEAQACGVPVVATAVGGLRTAVADGISGSLVDGHDPKAWSATLMRLIMEPSRRTLFSLGALEHSSHFGWSSTAREILGVYDQLLSAKSSEAAGA